MGQGTGNFKHVSPIKVDDHIDVVTYLQIFFLSFIQNVLFFFSFGKCIFEVYLLIFGGVGVAILYIYLHIIVNNDFFPSLNLPMSQEHRTL